jgi:hydroxyacylglutathione hydrolase
MKKTATLLAVCAFAASIASAQYKKQLPNSNPMPVQAAPSGEEAIAKVRRISEAETQRLLTNGSAVVIDVRSNTQFQLGHIKGSINIPGSQLLGCLKELPPGKTIVTYCA